MRILCEGLMQGRLTGSAARCKLTYLFKCGSNCKCPSIALLVLHLVLLRNDGIFYVLLHGIFVIRCRELHTGTFYFLKNMDVFVILYLRQCSYLRSGTQIDGWVLGSSCTCQDVHVCTPFYHGEDGRF